MNIKYICFSISMQYPCHKFEVMIIFNAFKFSQHTLRRKAIIFSWVVLKSKTCTSFGKWLQFCLQTDKCNYNLISWISFFFWHALALLQLLRSLQRIIMKFEFIQIAEFLENCAFWVYGKVKFMNLIWWISYSKLVLIDVGLFRTKDDVRNILAAVALSTCC